MKTINQSYTRKERLAIAKSLRAFAPVNKWKSLSDQAEAYVHRVVAPQNYIFEFALARGLDPYKYPGGHDMGYIRDACIKLAEELEACK